jgi:hypothetical protein
MAKKAIIANPPNLLVSPRVDFMEDSFDALTFQKGYTVEIEPFYPCPCKGRDEAKSVCLNCQGTGFLWGTPTQCKAIIQSINRTTKFREWSAQLEGHANITLEQRFRLAVMDKVTMVDSISTHSENVVVKELSSDARRFAVTCYPIIDVDCMFLFTSPKTNLVRLEKGVHYTTESNKIVFEQGVLDKDDSISIRYTHNVQYVVRDLNHDIRNSYRLDDNSREQQMTLPISAVIIKLHCIMDGQNFRKTNLLYNPTI